MRYQKTKRSGTMHAIDPLTVGALRGLFNYDPNTGLLTWISDRWRQKSGDVAGNLGPNGYIRIAISPRMYLAHRLAWFHFYGEWPSQCIDHINGVRHDNRIANLRDVPMRINLQNKRAANPNNKTSGLYGVSKIGDKWRAYIAVNSKYKHIGTFDTVESAHAAHIDARRRLYEGNTL